MGEGVRVCRRECVSERVGGRSHRYPALLVVCEL